MAMRCPNCGSENTKVLNTRERPSKHSVSRRLECLECQTRFTTMEFVVPEGMRPNPQRLIEHWQETRQTPPTPDDSD